MAAINKNLVVKVEEDYVQLPVKEGGLIKANLSTGDRSYVLLRTVGFNEQTGELLARVEPDIVTRASFDVSVQINSDELSGLNIKNIIVINKSSYISNENFVKPLTEDEVLTWKQIREIEDKRIDAIQAEENEITSNIDITVPFKDLCFEDGQATFWHFIPVSRREQKFAVINPFLRKEHDAIKNYFAKGLGAKKIAIRLQLTLKGSQIIKSSANSDQLASINGSLIDTVADYLVDKHILNSEDEIIDLPTKLQAIAKELGDGQINDASWLLQRLLTTTRSKHYFHLGYLSSKHEHSIANLKLTSKPVSFIFLTKQDRSYFLIWETYNTEEATYIWRLDEQSLEHLQMACQELIEEIKMMRTGKKLSYLRKKPSYFKRIEHNYTEYDNGFSKWRLELEKFMCLN